MPRQTTLIPKAPIARIFREKGVPRVGNKAMLKMVNFLTGRSEEIAARAIEIAQHRGSRTVSESDVALALKTGR